MEAIMAEVEPDSQATRGLLERIVRQGADLLAGDEGDRKQRDERRAQAALPPPTSPADPGSTHSWRIVPLGGARGQ